MTAPAVTPPTTTEDLARRFSTFQVWLQGDPQAPLDAWGQLRSAGPLLHSDEFGGYWIATRYEDIESIARRPEVFVNQKNLIPWRDSLGGGARLIPLELDGEHHRVWRQALADSFSPGTVNHFTPAIRTATVELIDAVAEKGSCDFVSAIAGALPAEAFLANFGVPRERLQSLLDFKNWLVREGLPNARTNEDVQDANRDILAFFDSQVQERAATGTDGHDVISNLLRARIDGQPIPREDIVNACYVTMMASLDTTTSVLSLSWARLATRPDLQKAAADPEQRLRLMEELIRHEPVLTTARLVAQETTLGGVRLEPGEMVLMSWGMAGLDPETYDRPDEIDLRRTVTRHLAFGVGPHRCLGMHLARRIIAITMEEWHARIPSYRITAGTGPVAHYSPVRGLLTLPLTFG
ncbi:MULTISPECIES: cytochrome P450 [unclassified Frankia]|uniref:cytochrome P450 n=1 Tax=unclassified Frankia TaxID=2632575 RepID=UPI002AD37116|nr:MULTISPECIES: cytochrome P450 [unclassified Frankia]